MARRPALVIAALAPAVILAASAALAQENPATTRPYLRTQNPEPPATAGTRVQQLATHEKDPASPRHTMLKSKTPDAAEIVRIDVDHDGDPDILERWWNGHRVRWFDENDDMSPTDVRGDLSGDAMQVDFDGDGYYDGPSDMNVKWVDDDNDGRADVQIFAVNPSDKQRTVRGNTAHWMAFIDVDHDGVNGYVNWDNFEFYKANWRVPPTTSPTHLIPPPNFSPDYMGNTVFLKDHYAPATFTNPEMNWENPFAFYDFDGDGLTEMTIRILDTAPRTGGTDDDPKHTFTGFANEAMGGWDLDNDSSKGNEMDFDLSFRFFSAADGSKGERIDYRKYQDKHNMRAPQWVLDGKYFRFDNWRKLDHFVYVTHDKCFDEMWNTNWGSCWIVFDEDDDDHRWERVEFQYPTPSKYSTKRWASTRGDRTNAGLGGHPQADSLGDRGEWDEDNSGKGKLYVGAWDGKLHLFGAESGAWTVDEDAKYWGSNPVLGNSSPENAPKVTELVQYFDTDNNGFFDKITFDYDGDEKVDLTINLLDYKTDKNPHPDVRELLDPRQLKWKGLSEAWQKQASLSFQEALKIHRAAWKKGLTDTELNDLAFASSIGERYDHGYWLKEKLFRRIDALLTQQNDTARRDLLRRAYFTHDLQGVCDLIDSLDANAAAGRVK
jgi:hypothetical protein